MNPKTATELIELVEKLRQDHNGIMSVILHFGHDGDNTCRLRDYNQEIGVGSSGQSMYLAVERAAADWRGKLYLSGSRWALDKIEQYANAVINQFGGRPEGIFSTATFMTAFNQTNAYPIYDNEIIHKLLDHPRIIRLAGGSHWLLLPKNFERYQTKEEDTEQI